jgi:predicted RND superfamily exporter protein
MNFKLKANSKKLKRGSAFLFLVVLGLTIFSFSQLGKVHFSYDIEKFFSKNDPDVERYQDFRSEFENENDYLIVGIKNDEGIFQEKFLTKVAWLTALLEENELIERVVSPTNLSQAIKIPLLGFTTIPILHEDEPENYSKDKATIYGSANYTHSFFSDDTLSVRMALKLVPGISKKDGFEFLGSVEKNVAQFDFDESHVVGRLSTQNFYMKQMRSEMGLFILLASLVVIVFLLLVMGNIRYTVLTLISISAAIINIFGIIGFIGYEMNLMTLILPAILLIIGASSAIHFYADLSRTLVKKRTKEQAIRESFTNTGVPIFFNAFTTSIGFASLILIPVEPVQYFGFFAAIGIFLTFSITLIVAISSTLAFKVNQRGVKPYLQIPAIKMRPRKGGKLKGTFVFLAILVVGGIAIQNTNINNYFLEDLDDESSLKKDLQYFEAQFDGIRPLEIIVTSNEKKDKLNPEVINELQVLEQRIMKSYDVHYIMSPLVILRTVNQALHVGNKAYYTIPEDQSELDKVVALIEKKGLWNKYAPTMSENGIRLSARVSDLGSAAITSKNENLSAFVAQELANLEIEHTGAAHLMDKANSSIAIYFLLGIIMAVLLSAICVYWITRSIRLSLISLIPNVIPLLFATIAMWIFGISLNIGTAMIFSIIYGLAVDDTLHFIFKYNKLKQEGYAQTAVPRTFRALLNPMLSTSLVLGAGFLIFGFSQFTSISSIGMIVGLSLFVALIADYYFLPKLLLAFDKKSSVNGSEIRKLESSSAR